MNSNFQDTGQLFKNFFTEERISLDQHFLLAVSGGLDSVVLCDLFHSLSIPFSIAHCNFNLRGEESLRDESFVRNLENKYEVPVFVNSFDTSQYAEKNKSSIQEAARNLRYEWFYQLIEQNKSAHIVTAHHADDNIETLLMHFFRGTGLQGLKGIPPVNKKIIRPLLNIRKEQLQEYAREKKLDWVEDSSNASSKYTRNYLRHELIPSIQKFYPEVENNLLHNIERFRKINRYYERSIKKTIDALVEKNEKEWRIPIRKLKKYDYEVLLFEIISQFGFSEKQVPEVKKLMEASGGKYISNENYQIIKHGLWLLIAPKSHESSLIPIEKEEGEIVFPGGRLIIQKDEKKSFQLNRSGLVAQLDAKQIEFPLVLRKWKQGDYFYPLGMRKKKKLSRFFIDNKLSRNKKEAVWVLESNKKIIWIVGMRIDDRYKITDSTQSIISITYKN